MVQMTMFHQCQSKGIPSFPLSDRNKFPDLFLAETEIATKVKGD